MNVPSSMSKVVKPGEAMFKICTLKTKYLRIQSSETKLSEIDYYATVVF